MAIFLKLRLNRVSNKGHYINMDLVQQISPSTRKGYGSTLYLVGDPVDGEEYNYIEVVETADEIMEQI